MNKMTTHYWGLLVALVLLTGCDFDLEGTVDDAKTSVDLETEDIENLVDSLGRIEVCGNMTLDEMMTANQIDDDCKTVLKRLIPDPTHNLEGTVIAAGDVVVDDKRTLTLIGTDADGISITADGDMTIDVSVNGTSLSDTEFLVQAAVDVPGMLLSVSNVLDYSGSMSNRDIDDAIDVFGDLFLVTPSILEHDYRIFSDGMERKTDFTSNGDILATAVARDDEFPRSSTSLFDTMGAAIEDLAGRDAMAKLLIVATDGGENTSVTYTDQSALFDAAIEHDVHIIIMGTLVADLSFMKAAATKTDGFYFYSKSFISLRDMIAAFIDAMETTMVVTLTDPDLVDATDITVTVNDIPVTF